MVAFATYYHNGRPEQTGSVVGSAATVDVFGPRESGLSTIVRTHLPDRRLGCVYISGGSREPMAAAREVWTLFEVEGVELP
ncbi:MAG: hypothetical protein LLG08_05560 [Actinomycetia bacterium]|nr:hypothetical protein [Actinomycetes bacterium]